MNSVSGDKVELSIVLPCLNEEKTVGSCVSNAKKFLEDHKIIGEIILADNGSTDRSREIAESLGARVIQIPTTGYGNALRGGFEAANGHYIIMGDSDGNHDLYNLKPFMDKLRSGFDLVVGNRFQGGIEPGSMTFARKYIGNPILSFLGRLFFRTPIRDFHCGLRGIRKEALKTMDLQSPGMELASEMIVKASLLNMRVCEVPTKQYPNDPNRDSHLNTFRDGWRHLRFMLLYSPLWILFFPAVVMLILGLGFSIRLFWGPITTSAGIINFHSLIYAGTFSIIGMNLLTFFVFIQQYAYTHGLFPNHPFFSPLMKLIKLEGGLLLGGLLVTFGILIMGVTFYLGWRGIFTGIALDTRIRAVYGSSILLLLGTQIIFASFILSILGIKKKQ